MLSHDDLPYRPCVGVVLFNQAGKVWLGKRLWMHDPEHREPDHLWQWPQGGIDKGEDPLVAAKRELFEETNVSSVTLLGEVDDWLTYDLQREMLGIALKGKYRGQIQRWFAFRFEGDDSEIDVVAPGGGAHPAEFSEWRWAALEEAPDLVVPFKRPVYERVVESFRSFER
ncbi:MAG: RNA pyrophosphohydrolase [Rhizobiales bacterium]|nr:RNA pyrophosphohydrolase [Hyphomicrobiales bacterium]